MKKIFCLLLALIFTLSFAACGSKEESGKNPNGSSNPDSTVAISDVKLPEQIVYDEDNVKITVTGLSNDNIFGAKINVTVENKGEKDILVQADAMAINNIMVTPVFSCEVAAGKKANDSIEVMGSELKKTGIELFKEIDVIFNIIDPDSYERIGGSGLVKLTTDLDKSYNQKINTEGVTAYDGDGVKIVIQKLSDDEVLGATNVDVYIENNSDKTLVITADNVSVNGLMINPLFSSEIIPGKVAIDEMSFLKSKLTENGITKISEIELNFTIMDIESFTSIKETQKVKVTF